jgi:hypothetical protein
VPPARLPTGLQWLFECPRAITYSLGRHAIDQSSYADSRGAAVHNSRASMQIGRLSNASTPATLAPVLWDETCEETWEESAAGSSLPSWTNRVQGAHLNPLGLFLNPLGLFLRTSMPFIWRILSAFLPP